MPLRARDGQPKIATHGSGGAVCLRACGTQHGGLGVLTAQIPNGSLAVDNPSGLPYN